MLPFIYCLFFFISALFLSLFAGGFWFQRYSGTVASVYGFVVRAKEGGGAEKDVIDGAGRGED